MNDNHANIHVNQPADFILFPDTIQAIRILNELDYLVFVATNQGGVGLGFLSERDLASIHDKMHRDLASGGAHIDEVVACIHKPHAGCHCRKPKPGMLLYFHEQYGFELGQATMVGDRESDVEAGQAAGMQTVKIGEGPTRADYRAEGILDAVRWIVDSGEAFRV